MVCGFATSKPIPSELWLLGSRYTTLDSWEKRCIPWSPLFLASPLLSTSLPCLKQNLNPVSCIQSSTSCQLFPQLTVLGMECLLGAMPPGLSAYYALCPCTPSRNAYPICIYVFLCWLLCPCCEAERLLLWIHVGRQINPPAIEQRMTVVVLTSNSDPLEAKAQIQGQPELNKQTTGPNENSNKGGGRREGWRPNNEAERKYGQLGRQIQAG